MKKSLLLGIAGMAAVAGTANVRAACIPTQDCAELGYKYTSSECAGDRIACPFDTSKFFCFEPGNNTSSSVATSGICCGYSSCHPNENYCQNDYGTSCYQSCRNHFGFPDCTDMQESCRTTGGTPVFQHCDIGDVHTGGYATFTCE